MSISLIKQGLRFLYIFNKHSCLDIAFTVENVEEISLKLVKLGGSVVNTTAMSANGSAEVIYCHDLDGMLIELAQELVF